MKKLALGMAEFLNEQTMCQQFGIGKPIHELHLNLGQIIAIELLQRVWKLFGKWQLKLKTNHSQKLLIHFASI